MIKGMIAQNQKVVIGVDVHMRSHVATARVGDEYMRPVHMSPAKETWRRYLAKFPGCEIQMIYEAGCCGFGLHDWICEIAAEGANVKCIVAPPSDVPKSAAGKRVKTDGRDSEDLIMAPSSKRFRPVVVPDRAKRGERQVVRTRQSLVEMRTMLRNQIGSMALFHGVDLPARGKWSRAWMKHLAESVKLADATGSLWAAMAALVETLAVVCEQIKALDGKMSEILKEGTCGGAARKLMELPGVGRISALTLATEVADFRAFKNSGAFSSYTGLVPGERSSGERRNMKGITRTGNARVRRVLVECAWVWLGLDPEARKIFNRVKGGKEDRKYQAIVALARRLAVKAYHVIVSGAPFTAAA